MNIPKEDLKYPKIVIPGAPISKKRRYKVVRYGSRYGIALDIKKSVLKNIIKIMQRCWGKPTITTPVQVKLTFFVASFPPYADVDHDNAKQLYLDLLQENKWKTRRMGENKGEKYLASEGAGILKDDRIVQSTDGTRFIFLCRSCQWGITGKRRSFTRNKEKQGCPGSTKCPDRKIEIEITDMVLNEKGFYE